ncbi:MAG: 4-hydroxy-3-methylbut-2-enyl diphosphate reductase [Muribaculaceae bacterium]|nr:4-hydroxy-3-methylbut-2-enyl diphosphate reductase [Muribaculaceae bacterium]
MAIIEIEKHSGFCFGVTTAISKAEQELQRAGKLFCLGDIVHNSNEVERLEKKGLVTISHDEMAHLSDVKVLLRAHGEPPETYELARRNNIDIIDATCPVVLQLQRRINASFNSEPKPQIVIYGKRGHAEVNGLVGQTNGEAIVIENIDEIGKIDFSRNICLYSQTTMSVQEFKAIVDTISQRIEPNVKFESYDTICRSVANRIPQIREFASRHEVILFVCGNKSSNGRILFEQCHQANPNSYLISNDNEIDSEWVEGKQSIGICGATSTPMWLMDRVKQHTQLLVGDKTDNHDD